MRNLGDIPVWIVAEFHEKPRGESSFEKPWGCPSVECKRVQ